MKSKPDENDTTQRRLQHVWETAIVQQDHFHVDQVVMEEPPETVYGGGKGFGANYNIGRATKLFKTFAVAHAVLAATVASHPRIKVYTVLPVQWQPSKKARGGLSTKEWSLRYANLILAKHGNGGDLHTEDDENIADALAMGWILTNPDLQCKV